MDSLLEADGSLSNEGMVNLYLTTLNCTSILNSLFKLTNKNEIFYFVKNQISFDHFQQIGGSPVLHFESIFREVRGSENQIQLLQQMFVFYGDQESSSATYFSFEVFLRKLFQQVARELGEGRGEEPQFPWLEVNDEFIYSLIITTFLFYEEIVDKQKDRMNYHIIMDVVLDIFDHHSRSLERAYSREKVISLIKMVCTLKIEIQKDKDVVLLDLLLDFFDQHMTLYSRYRDDIPSYENVLNPYVLLLFELIEAIFFYFLEPAKTQLQEQIPDISRRIL